MLLPDRSVARWILLLSSLGLLASGCRSVPDDFKRVALGDDDDAADDDDASDDDDSISDDDDSSSTDQRAPVLVVTDPHEAPSVIEGSFPFEVEVSDPDSDGVNVTVLVSVDGVVYNPATVAEGQPVDFTWPGPPPMVALAGPITWNSEADVLTNSETVSLQFCPVDLEGNAGDCVFWPEDDEATVVNGSTPTLGEFCQPGDMEDMNWAAGESLVALSDGNCLNYERNQPPQPDDFSAQFLLVLLNTNENDVNFTINWSSVGPPESGLGDDDDDATPPGDDDDDSAAGDDDDSAVAYRLPAMPRTNARGLHQPTAAPAPANTLRGVSSASSDVEFEVPMEDNPMLTCVEDVTDADLHGSQSNFFFREDISENAARTTFGARLRALGDNVAIYVDTQTPIDTDFDCDGVIDEPSTAGPAEGFDNCDLEEIVDIYDSNIFPTLTTLYGEPSDVDGNCRMTVFLTHRVNGLTEGATSELGQNRILKSFAEPEIDLWELDLALNPGSNQQDVLYLYAPDPLGIWGPTAVGLEDYLNYEVSGRMAIALQQMISYAVHRGVGKSIMDPEDAADVDAPPAEEDWLDDAMGLLAADVTGFGSISYLDAWIYMDRSHLLPLIEENTFEDFEDRGGQYLFVRYLHDLLGDGFIWDVLHAENSEGTSTQGIDSILQVIGGADVDAFNDFALEWATAMAVSGRVQSNGIDPLVAFADLDQYLTSDTVSVLDPENPAPGELFGANGYQLGFNVRGFNRTYTGGTAPAGPTELSPLIVKTENLDPLVFHPETDFFGTVSGKYGVSTILVGGIEQPENWLLIETDDGSELVGRVIRVDNALPTNLPLRVELIDGALIADVQPLGDLPSDGSELRLIGLIDDPEEIDIEASAEPPTLGDDDDDDDAAPADDDDDDAVDSSTTELTDLDRFGLSLQAVTSLGVWVDRRLSDLDGNSNLSDPFVAVVPASDMPNPWTYDQWNFGPSPANGPCADPALYLMPNVIMDWLAPQAVPMSEPVADGDSEFALDLTGEEGIEAPGFWECEFDHDQDGIPDALEQAPTNFVEQVVLRQWENLLTDPNFYQGSYGIWPGNPYDITAPFYDTSFVDLDSNEDPDDNLATAIPSVNIGGRAVNEGEEAVWIGTLPPGDYIIVVGDGGGGTGEYDLSVRQVVP